MTLQEAIDYQLMMLLVDSKTTNGTRKKSAEKIKDVAEDIIFNLKLNLNYLEKCEQPDAKYNACMSNIVKLIKDRVDIQEFDEAWEEEERYDVPMCIHCIGNGCGSCKGTGDAKIY